jgi:hypothetical protein
MRRQAVELAIAETLVSQSVWRPNERNTIPKERDSSLLTVPIADDNPKHSGGLAFSAVLLILCGLFSSVMPLQPMAFGQAEQGTITGAVKDTSGAGVRGAKVNATNVATNVVSSTVSDATATTRFRILLRAHTTLRRKRMDSLCPRSLVFTSRSISRPVSI